ncbi:hypothetical protein BY458DRAFT_444312 [Sporodiniella umbellata]|nr:hypothetical protein BY458DRAFT_444312 [Sporodiniella umbellata]
MAKIPTEIVFQILKALDDDRTLVGCVYVCRQWSSLALELLWCNPNFRLSSRCLSLFTTLQLKQPSFQYTCFIRRINLAPVAPQLNDSHLSSLAHCSRIRRLTLAGCYQLTDAGLCQLIDVRTGIGPQLLSLDLSDVLNLTDKTLLTIAIHCPKLQALNLGMTAPHFEISDRGVETLAYSCTGLKRIKLNYCVTITERSSIALATHCPSLIEIDLTGCGVTDQALYTIFQRCRELRELRLNQCDAAESLLTDSALTHSLLSPNYYEQLRLVDFTGVTSVTDRSLAVLVEAAPRIRNLVLNKCYRITDEGVISVARLGRYLHFLHLGHCHQLTDRSMAALASECVRIRYLDLACCLAITDAAVFLLAERLTRLRRIGLVKCSDITDAAIQALADHAALMERAHLSYCVQLTAPAIARLLCSCKALNHLSLTYIPAFLREDYQQFCRSAPTEFTGTQNQSFCVYSGKGVQDLRKYLHSHHLCHCHYQTESKGQK